MMEQNQPKQIGSFTEAEFKRLCIWLSAIMCAVFVLGALTGGAITSMSYAKAYQDGNIHICTQQEVDYQKAIFELEKCSRLSKGGFSYAINGSVSSLT